MNDFEKNLIAELLLETGLALSLDLDKPITTLAMLLTE